MSSSVSGTVRTLGRSLGRLLDSGVVSRTIQGGRIGSSRLVEIDIKQLIPATAAGVAILYQEGRDTHSPQGRTGFWKQALAEGGLGYFAIDKFKGVFSLWGMSVAAYRAGQQGNPLAQVQTVLNTALTMALGWVGIHLGETIFTEAPAQKEAKAMRTLLDKNHPLQDWIKTLEQSAKPELQEAGKQLRLLKSRLDELEHQYEKKLSTDGWQELKPFQQRAESQKWATYAHLLEHQAAVAEHLKKSGPTKLRNTFFSLWEVLKTSQQAYVRLARSMNPIFGYIIMGMLVGAPLSRKLTAWLDQQFPQLKQQAVVTPFNKKLSVLPSFQPKSHSGFPGQPALIMPGIGSGVLH